MYFIHTKKTQINAKTYNSLEYINILNNCLNDKKFVIEYFSDKKDIFCIDFLKTKKSYDIFTKLLFAENYV